MMSSYQWHLRNARGEEVENGADPDMPIERIENVTMEKDNPVFLFWLFVEHVAILANIAYIIISQQQGGRIHERSNCNSDGH